MKNGGREDSFSPVRPREAPPFKAKLHAAQRVNLAPLGLSSGRRQSSAFRPGSREVHNTYPQERRRSWLNCRNSFRWRLRNRLSDVHITTGSPPQLRVDGELTTYQDSLLTAADTKSFVTASLPTPRSTAFEEENELDFSFGIKGLGRFRGNFSMQRGRWPRAIPASSPSTSGPLRTRTSSHRQGSGQ